ncbi:hypothetical protein niasHT_033775 [Heterodera trifolii]|uniref:Uncharacterized protein n=1 Tax=Heterodera trifolii TaxID=157864 RepID=A0ABD2I0J7_9BILA
MTQTPFPGDNEMHIRTMHSAVIIPSGDQADHRLEQLELGHSSRDRANPRIIVPNRSADRSAAIRYRPYETDRYEQYGNERRRGLG